MAPRRLLAVATVALGLVSASAVCTAAYLVAEWPRLRLLGSRRDFSLMRAYLVDPKIRRFAAALHEEDPRTDVFKTMWDTNTSTLLSRRMFRELDMDGVPKYGYKPNVKKLAFIAGAGDLQWKMEMVDTPHMRDTLRDIDTTLLVTASYDEHGFRRVDPVQTVDCALHVMFLGDSFTDGPWVDDAQTFANVYGRLARDRAGVRVCPVNAGVDGYGSFEERWVLEHEFDEAGQPSLIFVMHFPNDVDQGYDAVVDGTPEAERLWRGSLKELRRIHRFAGDHHSTMVLVAIPPAQQVFDREPQTHYQDVLRVFAAQEGIMFVNLYEAFVANDARPLYWTRDPHFTPKGHQVVAELLYDATKELLK